MALQDRIPELTDAELSNLRANATRLEQAGTPRQQNDAAELLPLVNAELARRKEAATAARQAAAQRMASAPRKATAKKAVAKKAPAKKAKAAAQVEA